MVPEEDATEPIAWSKSATEGFYPRMTRCAAHKTPNASNAGFEHSGGRQYTAICCKKCRRSELAEDKLENEDEHWFRPVRRALGHRYCTTPHIVQRNDRVSTMNKYSVITWRYDDDVDADDDQAKAANDNAIARKGSGLNGAFVRQLEVGDCIALWAKGVEGPWMNVIDRVKISVYWAV